MSGRARGSALPLLASSALAAAVAWLTMRSWAALSERSADYAVPLFFLSAVVVLLGFLGRWRGTDQLVLVIGQLLVAADGVLLAVTGSALPTPAALGAFVNSWNAAVASAQEYVAPIPADASSFAPIAITVGAAVVLLVDMIACTLDRVPAAGLVLIAAYCAPVAVTGDGVSPLTFTLAAGCFAALLYVSQGERVQRWGHGWSHHETPVEEAEEPKRESFSVRTGHTNRSASIVGVTAALLALFVPLAVPMLDARPFDGNGPGDGEIEVVDPTADMRRDLLRGEDRPLLWLSTRGERPTYIRTAALTQFNGNTWSPGDRDIPADQHAEGALPPLVGVAASAVRAQTEYDAVVSDDFASTWLPTAPLSTAVDAPGDWRYDRSTMDFMSPDNEDTTQGLRYSFTAATVRPDAEDMNAASSGAGLVSSDYLDVPGSVSETVRTLTREIVQGHPTRFQQAQALQAWFREGDRFEYSLEAAQDPQRDNLDHFLSPEGRVGYCEQFAAAMAIMARVAGIPSRVAVGFLEPEGTTDAEDGSTQWVFSSHDMHAWVELFFPGSGWVRFDPTPAARVPEVPEYTTAELRESASPTPTAPSSTASEATPDRTPTAAPAPAQPVDEQSAFPLGWVLGALTGLIVLALLLLLPRQLRRRQRERRLTGDVEDLWAEVRAHAIDLGHAWPSGASPRASGRWLASLFGAPARPDPSGGADRDGVRRPRRGADEDPAAVESLDRLVAAVERSRYAVVAGGSDHRSLADDASRVCVALGNGVGPQARRRAAWWPRSLQSGRRTGRRSSLVADARVADARVAEVAGVGSGVGTEVVDREDSLGG